MKHNFKKLVLLYLPLCLGYFVVAQQNFAKVGTSGSHFINISPDARYAALGNGGSGLINDNASSLFYNPASLVYLNHPSLVVSQVNWFADIKFSALAGGMKSKYGSLGFQLKTLNSGDIIETTVDQSDGTGRKYNWNDMLISLTGARSFTDQFSIGLNLGYLKQSVALYGLDASAYVVDLGALYRTGFRSLTLGMAVRNFGPELDFKVGGKDAEFDDYNNGELLTEKESYRPFHMPLSFQVGITYTFLETNLKHSLLMALDGVHPNDSDERLNVGLEYSFMNLLFVRCGAYSNHDSGRYMGGFGLDLSKLFSPKIRVDYALSDYSLIGAVSQISLGILF